MSTRDLITISIGDVFGRLTVVAEAPRKLSWRYWLCQCSCGSPPKEVKQHEIGKKVKSCGCLRGEGGKNKWQTHGKTGTAEHRIWKAMLSRCCNPNNIGYEDYRHRAPPEVWHDFEVFLADMGPRPSPKHSIERLDNSKPYGPDNCLWATSKEQARNSSHNINIEYRGRSQCIAAWAEEYGMKYSTLYCRLATRKWPIEKALNTKVGN